MNIEVKKTFIKDFQRLPKSAQLQVADFLQGFQCMKTITELSNTKKLIGFKEFYRTRIGDYRIGWRYLGGEDIVIDRVLHRKDIYKVYP